MRVWFSTQLNLLWLAISFFTRLPVPKTLQYSAEKMHEAGRYFSLVGWLLALILIVVYHLSLSLFGINVSVVLLLMLNLLLTGALHQDGLADTFDGFFGGQNQAQKLYIMKDSRLGTYGTCALFITFLLQFALLTALAERHLLFIALAIAYPLSRAMALSHVQHLSYARIQQPSDDITSESEPSITSAKPITSDKPSKSDPLARPLGSISLLYLFGIALLALICLPLIHALIISIGCLILRALIKAWLFKHIGGYTGDSLGCAQQFQELLIYALLLALSAPSLLTASIG